MDQKKTTKKTKHGLCLHVSRAKNSAKNSALILKSQKEKLNDKQRVHDRNCGACKF